MNGIRIILPLMADSATADLGTQAYFLAFVLHERNVN